MAGNSVRATLVSAATGAAVVLLGAYSLMGAPSVGAQQIVTAPRATGRAAQRVTLRVHQAPLTDVVYSIARQAGLAMMLEDGLIAPSARVSVQLRETRADAAFEQVLRGTGLVALIQTEGNVVIVRAQAASVASGTIVGTVVHAATKQPLVGASVLLDGALSGVKTMEDGKFRIPGLAAGAHRVTVRLVGFVKYETVVRITDSETVTVNAALSPSVNALDQVVVTGTVVAAELKAVPNAITVITAKELEQRGITRIDQLFRGDVPGLFAQRPGAQALTDQVTMYSRGASAISTLSSGVSATTSNTNPIKTYVDGVEMADPQYLSQIDPRSIERIEILTGPQASTIYGSNALNGVMQIFTKRGGSSAPQLLLNAQSGWVENNFSAARTPQHDYSAQLNGVEGRMSYNAGGTWQYIGPWTPAKQSTRTNAFSGVRLELPTRLGRISADVSARRSLTLNRQRGSTDQTAAGYQEQGYYRYVISTSGLSQPINQMVAGQTFGFTLNHAPTSWWSHELVVGRDISETEMRTTAPAYVQAVFFRQADTTLAYQRDKNDRQSLRYSTTLRIPIADAVQTTLSAGGDAWQNLLSSTNAPAVTRTNGTLTDICIAFGFSCTVVSRTPTHNTGAFLQTQTGIKDRLFLTYGFRAEWNPNFGDDVLPTYTPRYGAAYTQDVGSVTAKLRASYGRSTRPPAAGAKVAQPVTGQTTITQYGPIDNWLANPHLTPEQQRGWEGGLELYTNGRGSLVITRYDQTVDGLITSVKADSARSLVQNPSGYSVLDVDGYGYWYQFQSVNVGSIRNRGWELQGTTNVGPFTARGTYSWTKSRVIGVDERYRPLFVNDLRYRPGATFRFLPEHTWAAGVTYAVAATTFEINFTGTGQIVGAGGQLFWSGLNSDIRLPHNRYNMGAGAGYMAFNSGYALADLNMSHRFSPSVDGVMQVQNAFNRYNTDFSSQFASLGRQVKLGARMRL
jgi:outer membrane receptor protein involved in Fe transport